MVFTVRNEEQLERATRGLHSCLCEVFEGGSSIRMMSFEDLQDNGVYTLLSADLTADQRKILIANFVQIRDNSFEALVRIFLYVVLYIIWNSFDCLVIFYLRVQGVGNLLTFLNDFGAYMVVTRANMACNGTVYGVGGVVTSEVGTLFIEGRLSASEGHIAIDQLETIISAFSTCTGDVTFTKTLAHTSNVNNDVHIKPLLQKSALSGKVFGVFFTENLDESVLAKCIEKNICYIYNTSSGYTPSPWTPFTFVVSAARLNTTGRYISYFFFLQNVL